jgi:hypothetical protein
MLTRSRKKGVLAVWITNWKTKRGRVRRIETDALGPGQWNAENGEATLVVGVKEPRTKSEKKRRREKYK